MQVDLEITYRDGKPRLGYLYLSTMGEKSAHSKLVSPFMVIDLSTEGRLIGIELLDPAQVTLAAINGVLKEHELDPLEESQLKPVVALGAILH